MPTDLIIPRPFHHRPARVCDAFLSVVILSSSSPRVRLGRLPVIAGTTDLIIPLVLPPLYLPPSFFPVILVFPNADDALRATQTNGPRPKPGAPPSPAARYTEAYRKRMDLGVGVHPSPSSLTSSLSASSGYTLSPSSYNRSSPSTTSLTEDGSAFCSLTDLKWGVGDVGGGGRRWSCAGGRDRGAAAV
ncbi:hypothetical protein FB451DRAFT_118040 [Mycena latifolia]|nr:hypothetical protein FB451DRAFT_118040 [Mycena latifolia]